MKTFYSVKHSIWGADGPSTAWFDNLAEAKKFAARDYSDNVVVHNLKNPERIREMEDQLKEADHYENLW